MVVAAKCAILRPPRRPVYISVFAGLQPFKETEVEMGELYDVLQTAKVALVTDTTNAWRDYAWAFVKIAKEYRDWKNDAPVKEDEAFHATTLAAFRKIVEEIQSKDTG